MKIQVYAIDAASILKPMLARGELQTIGATTLDEYRKYVEKDAALERRFQPIQVAEPSISHTIDILRGLRDRYEAHHRITITSAVHTTFSTLSATDRFDFIEATQLKIVAPVSLYAASLEVVADEALKSRLDTYTTEILKTDILPAAIQHLRSTNLLQREKSRTKDMEKFSLAISSAQSLSDISSSSAKLCRKQKIDAPSPAQLREAKLQATRQKVESMNRKRPAMRGSDVLQNTLWILLCAAVYRHSGQDVLFLSSGKDTTRMIKFYQNLPGNSADDGKKLEVWKDKLKAGQAGDEEIREMRDAAGAAVEEMSSTTKD